MLLLWKSLAGQILKDQLLASFGTVSLRPKVCLLKYPKSGSRKLGDVALIVLDFQGVSETIPSGENRAFGSIVSISIRSSSSTAFSRFLIIFFGNVAELKVFVLRAADSGGRFIGDVGLSDLIIFLGSCLISGIISAFFSTTGAGAGVGITAGACSFLTLAAVLAA